MKTFNKSAAAICLFAATFILIGCRDDQEDKHHFDNRIFITEKSFTNEIRIEKGSKEMSRQITVGIAIPENFDITAVFESAPQLLETYRRAYYDPEVELLPAENCDLAGASAVIAAGHVESNPLQFSFVNLDRLDLGKRYVLPVALTAANGVDILDGAHCLYFLFKEASLVNVVGDLNENSLWPEWDGFEQVKDMETFSFETLVYVTAFNNASDSHISTIMGIEDYFLVRIGDSTIPKNQLQIAYARPDTDEGTVYRGSVTNSSMSLQTGRWYHIAVTFNRGEIKVYIDGREKGNGNSVDTGIEKVDFAVVHSDETDNKPRCFWLGHSYDDKRYLDGCMAETRVWNRVLSVEEINSENHFYRVDPASEGLVAYWKFDDGKGNIITDYSPYGKHLTADKGMSWVAVELPAKQSANN